MNNNTYFMTHEGRIIAVHHGEAGYYATDVETQEEADKLNKIQGITGADCAAAKPCSMFDTWDDFDKIKAGFVKEGVK